MAEWVLVENNEIIEYHDKLPRNWRNISGLHLSINDTVFLKSLGWFKVQKIALDNGQVVSHYDYSICDDYVLETPIYKIFSAEDNYNIQQHDLNLLLEYVRSERNKKLLESDYTQLTDVIEKHTDNEKLAWKTYRQALRDFPATVHIGNNVQNLNWPNFDNILLDLEINVQNEIIIQESIEENIQNAENNQESIESSI